jgi:transposase, IS30 family
MTKKYTHLKLEQRYQIEALLKTKKSYEEIGQIVGVHKSTISREFGRNVSKRGAGSLIYDPVCAQEKTDKRHRSKNKHIRFTEAMKRQIRDWLIDEKLSPELISAKGKRELGDFVSHEAIYQWIWYCKKSQHQDQAMRQDKRLYLHLKHGRRRKRRGNFRDKRGTIHHRISIEKRPQTINLRKRIGDKEADLVLGKNRQPGLLVLCDRKTRMNWIEKITSKDANYIEGKIRKILNRTPHQVRSITFDNDLAFAKHYQLKEVYGIKTYFTHPYTSQEKGTIENRIGVIRQFFPKGTDFTKITEQEIKRVETIINNRPLRMFDYRTAKEMHEKMVV